MWPNRRLLDLLGIDIPIIQAPMAGSTGSAMAVAACEAGGLGSLPCAMLDPDKARAEIGVIRQQTGKPFNVNFFCHTAPVSDPAKAAAWKDSLAPYYTELALDADATAPAVNRAPFDEAMCKLMVEMKPAVISFHFGLPEAALLDRIKAAGCVVLSSATTVAEARWLEANGCDAIIAQGSEAGGHRGMFLSEDIATQVGTMAPDFTIERLSRDHGAGPPSCGRGFRAGDRGGRHRRWTRHRRRLRVGRGRRANRHGLSIHTGIAGQ